MALLNPISLRKPLGAQLVTTAASSGGDRALPGQRTFLYVKNGSASSINVTLDATGIAFNGQAVPDTVIPVPAGQERIIPLTKEYTSPIDGRAGIAYSAVTSVVVAVLQA